MRSPYRTLATAAALVTLAAAALTACGGEDDAPAAADKTITVYSGRSEELVKPILDKFSADTGIKIDARYGNTAATATQLLEEGDKSPADVFFSQDAGALGAVAKKGLFAVLPDEVTGKVPATYRAKSGEWVGVTARARVLVYSSDKVKEDELPKSVFDLTKPEWKGKVGVAPTNASFQAFVTAITVQHGEAKAKEFLAGLKANDPQVRDGNGAIVEEVDAGEIPVGLVNHYYLGEIAKERGTAPDALKAKLHFFEGGDTGALVNIAGVGVLKKAADNPDARALVDYLLSPEVQALFVEQTAEYPVVSGIPGPSYAPALDALDVPDVDLNDLDQLEATIALIKDSGLVP